MKIFLDVDGVVCDFNQGLTRIYPQLKKEHQISYDLPSYVDLDALWNDHFFWLSLPVLDKPEFRVDGYISHRPFPNYITEFWLYVNNFAAAPVYHVQQSEDKIDLLKQLSCDYYIDDKPSTYHQCVSNGINCFLYTQPWNQNIDGKRIINLKEFGNVYTRD